MSYGGFEYNGDGGGGYGGFDVMNGGGFGGDMGGGFMGSSDTPKSDKKASRDRQSLIPFSVKQLIGATQDPSGDLLMVDNSEVHTVKIMGIVELVEQHATNITYRINDGSGAIECKLWVEKDGDASKHEVCNQFSYIQVVGSLKSYEGRNHILVYKATPVEDFNEMTHHFLEVILTHLQHTKGPIPGSKAATSGASKMMASPGGGAQFGMQGQFSPGFAMTPGQSLQGSLSSGNESFHNSVLDILKQHGTGHMGLSIAETHQRLGGGHSLQSVRDAVLSLANDGVIYSTLDDEHYKSTE